MSTKRRLLFLLLVAALAIIASLPAPQPAWTIGNCAQCRTMCSWTAQCWCSAAQQVTSCEFCNCIN